MMMMRRIFQLCPLLNPAVRKRRKSFPNTVNKTIKQWEGEAGANVKVWLFVLVSREDNKWHRRLARLRHCVLTLSRKSNSLFYPSASVKKFLERRLGVEWCDPTMGGSQSRCQQPRVRCSLGRFHSKEACDARVNLRSVLVSPWLMWPRPPGGAKGWASSSFMSNRRPVTITRISPRHGTCPSALLTLSPIAIHKLVWNHRTDAKTTGSSTSRDDKKGETTGIEPRSVYISVETSVFRTHRRQTNEGKETGRK